MNRLRAWLFIVTAIFANWAIAQSSPIPMLQQASDQIINHLEKNKGDLHKNPQLIAQTVKQFMLPHVDVMGMSRSVLGRQAWSKASASEKSQFADTFTQLVIRTYASPLAEYTDEKVKFLPIRGSVESRFLRVNSLIVRSNGRNIPLSYSLIAQNGQWKIYDLSVEGVSLLQSFRSQFAQVLQNSDMQTLIKEMRQHSQKAA